MLTEAMEDYLKTVYTIEHRRGKVTTSQLAERLGVTSASVTGMIKRLADLRLLNYKPYRGVLLTKAGRKAALEVVRHHRLLERYLSDVMGVPWDKVHSEADRLEHVISEELEQRLDTILGQPETDPHGSPIPSLDGSVAKSATVCLADLDPGQTAVVAEVSDHDPELLRYLGSLGIYPALRVEVVGKAPFNGPLTIRIGGAEHAVGREAANEVFVTDVSR